MGHKTVYKIESKLPICYANLQLFITPILGNLGTFFPIQICTINAECLSAVHVISKVHYLELGKFKCALQLPV